MKNCPQCAEKIQDEALVCRHCSHQFDPDELVAHRQRQRNIGLMKVGGLIAGLAWLGHSCSQSADEKVSSHIDNTYRAADAPAPTLPTWQYQSRTDELRGKAVRSAWIVSENSADFDFPYSGKNHLRMSIRSHPQYGTDLILRVDKGQILCRSYSEPCKGMISIDGKAESLTFNESGDHDPTVVFAAYPKPLIAKIKGSKRVIIELPFYQEGNVQFTFNTEGLEWPQNG